MPCHLWLPEAGSAPGIVLFQEIFGVSAYIRARAGDLADLGYAVLAPELYWRLGRSEVEETGPDYLEEAMGLVGKLDWAAAVGDGAQAVTWLRARPEVRGGTGAFGFCFGGGLAFAVAATMPEGTAPDALVSYYGSALPQLLDLAPQVKGPSLHHFGLADAYIPVEQVRAIEAAVTAQGATFLTYEGAGHAFDNPRPEFHHEEASRRAWEATRGWLAQQLPVATTP
jgi:carboxymethylenebutenolidase